MKAIVLASWLFSAPCRRRQAGDMARCGLATQRGETASRRCYTTALVSRLNDKARDVMIVLMQRLHEDDLAGHLLQSGDWHHLNLPAIAEEDQSIALGRNIPTIASAAMCSIPGGNRFRR